MVKATHEARPFVTDAVTHPEAVSTAVETVAIKFDQTVPLAMFVPMNKLVARVLHEVRTLLLGCNVLVMLTGTAAHPVRLMFVACEFVSMLFT